MELAVVAEQNASALAEVRWRPDLEPVEEQQELRQEMAAANRTRVRVELEAPRKRHLAALAPDAVACLVAAVVLVALNRKERSVWQREKEAELEMLAVDWQGLEFEN